MSMIALYNAYSFKRINRDIGRNSGNRLEKMLKELREVRLANYYREYHVLKKINRNY